MSLREFFHHPDTNEQFILGHYHALTKKEIVKLKKYSKECAKITGVDKKLVINARRGVFSNDAKLKQQLLCSSKKIGFQNEAGELQLDVMKQKVQVQYKDPKVADVLIKKCAIQQNTPEETAFEIVKCYYKNTPNRFSLV
ncbi:hypothetical protein HHI36_002589 [Cryptolaemus montrouzieri]|uniref:Uncharacterized protein n=1 Tax=Cryptolaemus montrouzieri TaxID=559131 RepID=A0ABD2PBV5_9CUCU